MRAPTARLVSVDCPTCGAPVAVPRFAPVQGRCGGCGQERSLSLPTHGGLRSVELGFRALFMRGAWLDAMRRRDAEGLVIAERCDRCEGPMLVPAATPLEAPCAHCGRGCGFSVGEHVVDALPASQIRDRTWGGGIDLSFRPSLLEASVATTAPCPGCGAALPAFRGAHTCAYCRRSFLALLAGGRRFLVGFHVAGDDEGRQVDGWVPVGDAVAHYAARRELSQRSNRSTFVAMGLWMLMAPLLLLAIFAAGVAVLLFGTVLLPSAYHQHITSLAFGAFGGGMLLIVGLFVALAVSRMRKHREDRAELTAGLRPLAVRGFEPMAAGGRDEAG